MAPTHRWTPILLLVAMAVAVSNACGSPRPESLPAGVPDDWWSAVQRDIARSEYDISPQSGTMPADRAACYQAPNRAQRFLTCFTSDGIRVIPRTTAPAWDWGLSLTRWGRALEAESVPPSQLLVHGNRIEYHRGDITEWYVNDARGLEQGFTIARAPGALDDWRVPSGREPLRMELAVTGSLKATLSDEGQAVNFMSPNGTRVIRFDHLHAVDARGRVLPAGFERHVDAASGEGLAIVVDDAQASYPITIDPLATTPDWTADGDSLWAHFGASVATAGDVNGDGFSDVIIGAPSFQVIDGFDGRAYVYYGSASGLSLTPNWVAQIGQSSQRNAEFGWSVASAGDVNGDGFSDVIVGAPYYRNYSGTVSLVGAAFVYHGSASGLSPTPNWTREGQPESYYGSPVASAGDVNGDGFSDVIVGAYLFDNGQADEGGAFVYLGSPGGLSLAPSWTAEGDQAGASFGYSAGTAGDVNGDGYSDVIVGAPSFSNGQTQEGRAYVFHGSASGLSPTSNWTSESDQDYANLGRSVATAGDVNGDGFSDVIVGAPYYGNAGRAYVFLGSGAGVNTSTLSIIASTQVDASFGNSVATAGDTDGDGYSDVIVGAPFYDNGQSAEGRAFVYFGSNAGLITTPSWTDESDQEIALFGWSAATAGDVNGDGFSDIIVGAYQFSEPELYEGKVFVYHGSVRSSVAIPVGFDIEPNTLNLNSLGHWVSGTITVEAPLTASDIDVSSILLNGVVGVDPDASISISHGGTALTVKFRRADVIQAVLPGDDVTVTVTGMIAGNSFEGSDVITVKTTNIHHPQHGDVLSPGSQLSVDWNLLDPPAPNVAILASADDGQTWNVIAMNLPNTGAFYWTVPNWSTAMARLAVVQVESTDPRDPSGYTVIGALGVSEAFTITGTLPVPVPVPGARFALSPLRNPSTGALRLSLSLPTAEPGTLSAYDVTGRMILSRQIAGAGSHSVTMGEQMPAGLYVVRLAHMGRSLATRVTVIR